MRCKHRSGHLTEITEYVEIVSFDEGEIAQRTYVEHDAIQGYSFRCDECSRVWNVSLEAKKPKWLQDYIERSFG